MSVWTSANLAARVYDFGVEHASVARAFGYLLWGGDATRLFDEIGKLRDVPDDTSIIDVPCGGGVAFRGLAEGARPRYAAVDISPVMLSRARDEATRRGHDGIEFAKASVTAMPYGDASFDLCMTFNGLHCFPQPADAISEMARVLKPGGTIRGSMVVRGAGLRQNALISMFGLSGHFSRGGREADLRGWLSDAGFGGIRIDRQGALAYFEASL